ncbi:MAG: hypothetical protein WBB07_29385 [Mycobacterium sp.]
MRVQAALAAVAIAAAAFVWHNLPVNSQIYAPFDVTADAGSPAVGRNLTATVIGTQLTPLIRPENGYPPQLEASGIWVVVNATVAAVEAPGLLRAQLQVGPNSYNPTDRLMAAAQLTGLQQPELMNTGVLVFDVAPEVLADVDAIELRTWLGDERLDSRLVVQIVLDGPQVSRLEEVRLPRPLVSAS